jgi:parallel beta-helix repeat protein
LQIKTTELPVGTILSTYSATLIATGGVPPYSWNTISGQFPAGLALNSATGTILGVPKWAGSFSFATNVQDSKGAFTSTGFSLNVSTAPAPAISAVSPNVGTSEGGTYVTISGQNIQPGAMVQFGGLRAVSVQVLNSNELQAETPAEPSGIVTVTVQNSDGQMAATEHAFSFVAQSSPPAPGGTTASWSPAELGVPWSSDFTSIAANVISVKTDRRLSVTAKGDGVTDDTAAIRAAIHLASSSGGGVVYFPVGDYKILAPSSDARGTPLVVPSRVILQGSTSTTSRIFVNDPNADSESDGYWTYGGISFQNSSLSGMTDLGVYAVNSSSTAPCALLWNRGTAPVSELFFNNLDIHLSNCRSFWFERTNNLLVRGSHVDSSTSSKIGNAAQYGPLYLRGDANLTFSDNTVTYHFGRVRMEDNTGLLVLGNTFIRDAENLDMQDGTAVESGGIELSFSQNVQVLDNVLQTLNAPSDETDDGESILTQNSNTPNVLDKGSSTAITSTTLTDTNALWGSVTASRLAQFPEVVAILTGPATGEWRAIQGINTNTKTITVNQPWNPVPEAGSLYSIFEWTLTNATIQGNKLIDNPNGIFLYDGCYNCTIQNNTLSNSRGILLRTVDKSIGQSLYPEARGMHDVAINDRILNNTVSNTSGLRPAYIAVDAEAFAESYRGMGMMNIQASGNILNLYSGNPSQTYKSGPSEITREGFFPCFLFGPAAIKDPITTVFQNITMSANSQSSTVNYGSYFAQFTTQACVSQ